MARIITKELAVKIVAKLGGKYVRVKGAAHDLVEIWHGGQVIASFGMRHGSSKDLGHDHIPGEIFVGTGFAKLLGQCPKSRDEWLQVLQAKGVIASTDEDAGKRAE
jgi:hypothetical protein